MKRKLIAIVGTLMLLAALVPMTIAATPEMATRDLPVSVSVNAAFDVTITVTTGWGNVVETLPAGFSYVSCAAGTNMVGVTGTALGQVVTFTFFASTTPATFTYTVTAPSTAVTGAAFSGVIQYGSPVTEEAVGGETTMDVGVGVYYTLTTAVSPAGSGTVYPSSGTYAAGVSVTLTATEALGYDFSHWSGTNNNAINPTTVTMSTHKTVTANFVLEGAPPPAETFAWWLYETFIGPFM